MIVIDAERIAGLLAPRLVADALRRAFCEPIDVPVRHHHAVARPGGETATLLLMPAWHASLARGEAKSGQYIGIKIATVFPENAKRHRPTVDASYVLMAGDTGAPLAIMDGRTLTLWRTAAASALAADYLASPTASRLLMIGAGAMAPYLIQAHATVRPITQVSIWNRDPTKAETLARELGAMALGRAVAVTVAKELQAAVASADVISAATLAREPLIKGSWLRPGSHVDLVGGFTPEMREADDEAVRRATVFVDTRAGAMREAGDLTQPIANGVIGVSDIAADLFDLCRSVHPGRTAVDEITLFKSVGTAIEDLAAAVLVYDRAVRQAETQQ
jgi:ornithine cyclodeaminase/alanine dehydrogenase-like protein (mu-crystallin family)